MPEIIKTYKQSVGATRFIGKKYGDADRVDGSFGAKWGEWFEKGWFDTITSQFDGDLSQAQEDGGAYIGLMQGGHDTPFEYWIGVFMPEGTAVPEGCSHIDFPAGNLGVCWVYGKEHEVYMQEGQCWEQLEKEGYVGDPGNSFWGFERYVCPRFTTPDGDGNIVLDICFFVK